MMRKTLLCRGVLFVAGLLVLGSVGCNKREAAKAAPAPIVTVALPVCKTVAVYGQYIGQLDSPQTVELRTRVEGFLKEIHFHEGQDVEQGALMFEIDPAQYEVALQLTSAQLQMAKAQVQTAEAALLQAKNVKDVEIDQANLAKANAELVNANQNLEEVRCAVAANAAARSLLEAAEARQKQAVGGVDAVKATLAQAGGDYKTRVAQAEANQAQATASVATATAQVAQAKLNLLWTKIYSPLKGRVGLCSVKIGALVGHNNDPTLLATVSLVDPVDVYFVMSEREAFEWKKLADEKKLRHMEDAASNVKMLLENGKCYEHKGKIDFVDRTVDAGTGTLKMRAEFPNPEKFLRPGNYAKVKVMLTEEPDALLVDEAAIGSDIGGEYVLVVDAKNTVEHRSVKTGPRQEGLIVVEKGLKAGEQVIVEGLQRARPGALVTPQRQEVPAPAKEKSTQAEPRA